MKRLLTLLSISLLSNCAIAGGYDIQLYPLHFDEAKQKWSIGKGKSITERDGYDNQASFTRNSKSVVFVSDRKGQFNDIYRYDINTGKITQLTDTPNESEFSPTDTENGLEYVVEQGVPHQSVWYQQGNKPRTRAINSMIPTGYYATNPELGTLMWARYAYSLYFEPKGESANEGHFVASNVGRSLHVIPNTLTFSYLHKLMDGNRIVKSFNPASKQHQALVSLGTGSEDYAWGGLKASGLSWIFNVENGKLRAWPYEQNGNDFSKTSWTPVADLIPPTPQHQTANRIAISPDNRFMTIIWSRN
ncbi:PD40 domain-containing protein [Shewanella sp. 202IG2-18]|uniref:TolB family protein n=1 Tax=Parashewanella hymeniacidonis TaxID=2807618 RepID=UPI001962011E|nr:PD40 domain-containing protein [Parashewanella hymeniacidonis]MBM7071429.1 PD40 domain-containing protein [Parashewanella hymeniacidonis]